MKYFISIFLVLSCSKGFALDATGAAEGAAAGAGMMAIYTVSSGSALMRNTCGAGPWGAALCAAGAALVVTAIADAHQADKDAQTASQLTPGATTTTPGGDNGGGPVYQSVAPYATTASQIAAQNGTTLDQLASQASTGASGAGVGGGSGTALGVGDIPPAIKAAMDQAGKDAMAQAKYRVLSVPTEGGGGGGGNKNGNGTGGMDIAGLLASLQKNREPASSGAQGLQKSLNGDPIGVAGDNIFAKITRAYQAKTQAQTFLPPLTAPSEGSAGSGSK